MFHMRLVRSGQWWEERVDGRTCDVNVMQMIAYMRVRMPEPIKCTERNATLVVHVLDAHLLGMHVGVVTYHELVS